MRLGEGSRVPHPRPGSCLWRGIHLACSGDGHPRSTDLAAIALAECLCRTADRFDPAGMHRPSRRAWRAAPSARAAVVYEILQRDAHTLITEQGCADTARCSGRRAHAVLANLGRIASPIRPDLIFDRDNARRKHGLMQVCPIEPLREELDNL